MASQRDVKNKIASVKNIQKITRAMEMVAGARLRRAEQRITALRPYADALARMTRQAALAAGAEAARLPLLAEHETQQRRALLIVTGDRGLAGAFNSQIVRAAVRRSGEIAGDGAETVWYATGRRGVSSLGFRGHELAGSYTGFSDRPAFADARGVAADLMSAYVDSRVDRVEMIFNSFVSPLTQNVTRQVLLPVSSEAMLSERDGPPAKRAPVDYEPDPEAILRRLVPDYIETSI